MAGLHQTETMLYRLFILHLWFGFLIVFVNTETFTKLDNKTVSFGSVSSVSLENGCHFCACLVRCTEDVYCV